MESARKWIFRVYTVMATEQTEQERRRNNSKRIALVIGALAILWYVVSMFVVLK